MVDRDEQHGSSTRAQVAGKYVSLWSKLTITIDSLSLKSLSEYEVKIML
jgi:hypothetical protein